MSVQNIIDEIDEDGNGEVSFEEFANLAARFLIEEEEDTDAIQMELKGAFRLYDRDGNGFITTDVLREILRELDDKLSDNDLDNMIEEIDTDGSGTVDWDGSYLKHNPFIKLITELSFFRIQSCHDRLKYFFLQ